MREDLGGVLTEMPDIDNDEVLFYPGNEDSNFLELRKAQAIIRGLRERSKEKAESNVRLSMQNDQKEKRFEEMNHVIKTMGNEKDRMFADIGELEQENARLVDELTKANEYQRTQQEAVISLHEQIQDEKDRRGVAEHLNEVLENELIRFQKMVDYMLKHNGL